MMEIPSLIVAPGGFDLAGLLHNPSFMRTTSNLMNNAQVQQIISVIFSGFKNAMAVSVTAGSPPSTDLESILQAGQHKPNHKYKQLGSASMSFT